MKLPNGQEPLTSTLDTEPEDSLLNALPAWWPQFFSQLSWSDAFEIAGLDGPELFEGHPPAGEEVMEGADRAYQQVGLAREMLLEKLHQLCTRE